MNSLQSLASRWAGATRTWSVLQHRGIHGTAAALANKHPKQIKKENLAKRAARLAEFERTKPSPILSQPAPFFNTLYTPDMAYRSTNDYQHFLTDQDKTFLFEETPRTAVEKSHLSAVEGIDAALAQEQSKVSNLQNIISLRNANAKAVQIWNIHKAIDWFKRKEADTGSPEVQAAILTIRILNLHGHLQYHRKDKHNYRQLRSMVHKRAKILKYLKTKSYERYQTCLEQLGLQPRAVEGEITL